MDNMQKQRVRNSVKASVKDGVAWAAMSAFADPYAVPFAMALGASTMGIGVLRLGSCKKSLLLTYLLMQRWGRAGGPAAVHVRL